MDFGTFKIRKDVLNKIIDPCSASITPLALTVDFQPSKDKKQCSACLSMHSPLYLHELSKIELNFETLETIIDALYHFAFILSSLR